MKAIMFQGTGSDVGKSLLVAGLARAFTNRGLSVRPFKAQNMSNNAAVTPDGGEIGRAQALQARAARVPASVHMNPVLLKPESETGAQVVVQGRRVGMAQAHAYQRLAGRLMAPVLESFALLSRDADVVLVEGAGAASEVNLRAGDIANMGFAEAAGVPVVLVGDIERGGVIASLVGTKHVLGSADEGRIAGFIVNKFRGDPSLFDAGMAEIAARTGWPALGLVPYFRDAERLPQEDTQSLAYSAGSPKAEKPLIAVLAYPRISNFDDFDPLRLEASVDVAFLRPGTPIPAETALVVLPGSKATMADLSELRRAGWDVDLLAHVRRGGAVLGICGGYQMLGRRISDPDGLEGPPGETEGLGLIEMDTVLTGEKLLRAVSGASWTGAPVEGYEMHVGRSSGAACEAPMLRFADGHVDGAVARNGAIAGCYLHGLFANDAFRTDFLSRMGARAARALSYDDEVERTLDAFAAHLEQHVDCDRILEIAGSYRSAAKGLARSGADASDRLDE